MKMQKIRNEKLEKIKKVEKKTDFKKNIKKQIKLVNLKK